MTVTIAGFDPRAPLRGVLDLVNVNTPTGDYGFILGTEGRFTDTTGKVWWGSQLLGPSRLDTALNGVAPAGSITMAYFQDPNAPDLITQIKADGDVAIASRPVTFYWQPLTGPGDMLAPTIAPQRWLQRTARRLTFEAQGANQRSITLGFEAWSADRSAASRRVYGQTDHAKLLGGASNPSLEFMPTEAFEEELLFG